MYRRGVALGFAVATGVLGCSGPEHPRPDSMGTGSGAGVAGTANNAGSGAGISVPGGGASNNGGSSNGNAGSGSNTSTTGGANGTGSSAGVGGSVPTAPTTAELIPQRIRRMTNAEFDASVTALIFVVTMLQRALK